jgi:hypothetical protein
MASGQRRYSAEEMRRILAHAAATDAESGPGGSPAEVHTLAEIRDVATEAGIAPAAVDRAAAALEEPAVTHEVLGFPLTLQKEDLLRYGLSREQMLSITRQADRTFGASGSVSEGDDWMQWHNERKRMFVGMVRSSAGTRVRIISDLAGSFAAGVGTIAVVGCFLSLNALMNSGGPGDLLIAAGVAAATYGAMRLFWSQRCGRAVTRMQQMLDAVHAHDAATGHDHSMSPPITNEVERERS